MNRKAFYDFLRESKILFPSGKLLQPNVDGINALLDAIEDEGVPDNRQAAYILASVYHETGGYMFPIKETVQAHHKEKNPSDAKVIKRLDRAYSEGVLSWVKEPYWRGGYFGRGQIQLTHKVNYKAMGTLLKLPLADKPEMALEPKVSALIAVVGMMQGVFRGSCLADFFYEYGDSPVKARNIINGDVKVNGPIVAGYYQEFLRALVGAGGIISPEPEPEPADNDQPPLNEPEPDPVPLPRPEPKTGGWPRCKSCGEPLDEWENCIEEDCPEYTPPKRYVDEFAPSWFTHSMFWVAAMVVAVFGIGVALMM